MHFPERWSPINLSRGKEVENAKILEISPALFPYFCDSAYSMRGDVCLPSEMIRFFGKLKFAPGLKILIAIIANPFVT